VNVKDNADYNAGSRSSLTGCGWEM